MHRTIIIDKEKHSRENLCKMLNRHCPDLELVAKCGSLKTAEVAIDKHKPDLVFLDLAVSKSHSFDMVMQLKETSFEIIFVASYEQYAKQAVRFSGLDFLVKPISLTDLLEVVRRTSHKITRHQHKGKIDSLLNNMKYINTDKKIALATLTGLEFITIGNILRCESDNTYTIFHMTDKSRIVVSKSIGEYEELLTDYHFLRIHQSHIINLRYVKNYSKGNGGRITMEDNSQVDVSRRRKEQLLTRLSLI